MQNVTTTFDKSDVIGAPAPAKPYVVDITGISVERLPYLFGRIYGPSGHNVFRDAMLELVRANPDLDVLRVVDPSGRVYFAPDGNIVRIPAGWPDPQARSQIAMRVIHRTGVAAAVEWDQIEKVIMRELTRKRGQDVVGEGRLAQSAIDAANQTEAAKATEVLKADPCDVQQRLFDLNMPMYQAAACFAAAYASMGRPQRLGLLAELQGANLLECIALASKHGSLFSAPCQTEVFQDPSYKSLEALKLASWNPYNPAAGQRWTPGYQPGGGGGGGGSGEYNKPPSPPPIGRGSDIVDACAEGNQQYCDWIDYCQKVKADDPDCGFYCGLSPELAACQGVDWNCTPWPDCMGDQRNVPRVCEPFPECMAKRENWPDVWDDTVAPPCSPYPDCLPGWLPPALPGKEPGKEQPEEPNGEQQTKRPWYKHPAVIVGGAAAGILLTVGLVTVAVE